MRGLKPVWDQEFCFEINDTDNNYVNNYESDYNMNNNSNMMTNSVNSSSTISMVNNSGFNSSGLVIELWNRGMSWDKLLGLYWISLNQLLTNNNTNNNNNDRHDISTNISQSLCLTLDSELLIKDNLNIIGTKNPTNHVIYIDLRIEHVNCENSVIDDDIANNINAIINSNLSLNHEGYVLDSVNFINELQQQQQEQQRQIELGVNN